MILTTQKPARAEMPVHISLREEPASLARGLGTCIKIQADTGDEIWSLATLWPDGTLTLHTGLPADLGFQLDGKNRIRLVE
jgi:hypothetical protein